MKKLTKIGLVGLCAAGAWGLLLKPRRNHPAWGGLDGVRYAHRGLHDAAQGIPENSMAAFRRAVAYGCGAELDVHLMADGELAVVHDSGLKRMCGVPVEIEDLTAADLPHYPLLGTQETIPLLRDVLDLFEGKTPLLLELEVERDNANALTDAVMAMLKDWRGTYCVESFHPLVLLRLKEKYPEVIRGQLSENFLKARDVGTLSVPGRFILTNLLTTAATSPDFIAYKWQDRRNPSLRLMRALYGVREAGWTIQDRQTLEALEQDGVIPIFEGFLPAQDEV